MEAAAHNMASFTISARLQQRSDTKANWQSRNPILLVGEIGIEIDTGKLKVGNGVTPWNSLAYIGITTEYLEENYLPKTNPTIIGSISFGNSNTKISRDSISPAGNNIGVTGIMLTHYNSDEGGLLINEDGAYLWNSTDSGSALKIIDEDNWSGATNKKDATFSQGLLLNLDSSGNLKIKGKLYETNGENPAGTSSSQILNQYSGGYVKIWVGITSQYNSATKDSNTIYFVY
jgi:hypothetical protein